MVSVTFQVIYLLIIFLRVSNGDLQYKCEAGDGDKVQITINKTANSFTKQTLKMLDVHLTCVQSSNDSFFTLKDCPAETDILAEFTNAEPHNVLRRKDVEVYKLYCHYKKESVIKTVTAAPFKVTEQPAATKHVHNFQNTKWIPTLSMEVDPNSGIVIGKNLTVKISSRAGQYTIAAQECKATSGTIANSLVLWNSKDCTSGDKNLFGVDDWSFSKSTTIDITHRLEAFRFTDSNTLQLECTVKICPQEMDRDCALSCNKTPNTRRRRDVNSKTTVVKTTLNVVDSLQDFSSSGSGPFLATSLVSTAVIMYSMVL